MRADWYERAFIILHIDHHVREKFPVGRDADEEETLRLIRLSSPDVLQIHAKGNPGWTTYPATIGFTPPLLERDVMDVWNRVASRLEKPFSAYFNLGRDREIMRRKPEWNRVDQGGILDNNMLSYSTGVTADYLYPMIDVGFTTSDTSDVEPRDVELNDLEPTAAGAPGAGRLRGTRGRHRSGQGASCTPSARSAFRSDARSTAAGTVCWS